MENAALNTSTEVSTLRPSADDVTSVPVDESVQLLMTTTKWLWTVFPPVLLALGTCGNALSIAVLSRSNMRHDNVALYLIVLAVVDTMVLYTCLLSQWLLQLTDVDIRELSPLACKLHTLMLYFMLDMSVWILVALTFERLISVCLPLDVKRYCNTLTSSISLSVIAVILMAINSHFLYMLGDESYQTNVTVFYQRQVTPVRHCIPLGKENEHFYNMVWPWIDLCIFSLVPLSLIVVCNSAIIIKVHVSRRNYQRIIPGVQTNNTSSYKVSSMTATLLTLNLVLLITTMPVSAYIIVEFYYSSMFDSSSEQYDPKVKAEFTLAWAIVNMLMYTNNSVNFLLYCVSGTRFREELSNMFRRKGYSQSLRVPGSSGPFQTPGQEKTRSECRALRLLEERRPSIETVVLQDVYMVRENSVRRQLQQHRLQQSQKTGEGVISRESQTVSSTSIDDVTAGNRKCTRKNSVLDTEKQDSSQDQKHQHIECKRNISQCPENLDNLLDPQKQDSALGLEKQGTLKIEENRTNNNKQKNVILLKVQGDKETGKRSIARTH